MKDEKKRMAGEGRREGEDNEVLEMIEAEEDIVARRGGVGVLS